MVLDDLSNVKRGKFVEDMFFALRIRTAGNLDRIDSFDLQWIFHSDSILTCSLLPLSYDKLSI